MVLLARVATFDALNGRSGRMALAISGNIVNNKTCVKSCLAVVGTLMYLLGWGEH